MNECLKPEGGSPRQASNFQPEPQFGVNKNSSKNNLLNSMYHMQNASVADELGKYSFLSEINKRFLTITL